MKPCPYCGTPMSNPRRVQCGSAECFRAHRARLMREYLQGVKARTGTRYEDRYKVERICAECGCAFGTRPAHGSQICTACQRRAWRRLGRAHKGQDLVIRAAMTPPPVIRQLIALSNRRAAPSPSLYIAGSCRGCGRPFVSRRPTQWCSSDCRRRDRPQKRGRVRGAYSRRAIFERDRWTCRLCGKRVKRTAKVPDPKAPVIDHIVPLAAGPDLGGVDAPWNVQCAHFLCNSIKSASYDHPALALEVA